MVREMGGFFSAAKKTQLVNQGMSQVEGSEIANWAGFPPFAKNRYPILGQILGQEGETDRENNREEADRMNRHQRGYLRSREHRRQHFHSRFDAGS